MNHNRKWSLSAEADPILIEQSKRPESISSQTDSNEQPDNYYPVSGNRRFSGFAHNSAPTNIPKASTFKMFLHSPSVSHSFPKPDFNMGFSPSDHQILSNHLIEDSQTFGSVSHSMLGGETTRDIYQWKEKQQSSSRARRNSEPNLVLVDENEESIVYASELREPGVFRRFFMTAKAAREGKAAPVITKNFIDFLVLYGTYGGDVCPSDDEEDGEEDEDAPLLRTKSRTPSQNTQVQGTSAKKAFFMLLKAFVGTGVLFLPQAFKNGGMGFSIGILMFLGYLNLYCMNLLVEASIAMGGLSFGDLAHQLFVSGFRKLVLGSIAISQMGFSCAYYIFVATNLRYLTLLASGCRWDFPQWFFMAIQVLVYVPLSLVRKIKSFSVTSLIADVFILFGLAYILSFDIFKISSRGIAKDLLWINLESFPLLIGTAMFAFEGICLILPIAGSMKKPEEFSSVIKWCMFTIVVVLIVIGSMGYLAFGSDVSTVIFLDLPQGSFPNGLQFLYVIAIILSFPLCVYPAIRITEQGIFGHKNGKSSYLVKWQKNIFRTLLVSFLGVVSWAGSDSLDKVVSLVGCLACIPLSFIYPAMFHYKITTSQFYKTIDILLIVFGTISMIYTTFVTLQQWAVNAPSPQKDPCRI